MPDTLRAREIEPESVEKEPDWVRAGLWLAVGDAGSVLLRAGRASIDRLTTWVAANWSLLLTSTGG